MDGLDPATVGPPRAARLLLLADAVARSSAKVGTLPCTGRRFTDLLLTETAGVGTPLNRFAERISRGRPCTPPVAQAARDLASWIRSTAILGPTDFRIPRSFVTDAELPWDVIQLLWWGLTTPYEWDQRVDQASEGQRAIYALIWTRSEVENGGFHQYFWNSTGSLTEMAIEGARHIRADEFREVLERAASVFPSNRVPIDREQRAAVIDNLADEAVQRLDEADRLFYELARQGRDLDWYFTREIESHADEFFLES